MTLSVVVPCKTWISVTRPIGPSAHLGPNGHPRTERHFLRSLSTNVQGIALIHDGSNVRIMVGAGQILTSTVTAPVGQGGPVISLGHFWSLFVGGTKTSMNPAKTPISMLHPNRLRRKSSKNLFSSREKGSVKPQTTNRNVGGRSE